MISHDLKCISEDNAIIFYDGICNLCDGFVNFVIRKDPDCKIKFCALQDSRAVLMKEELKLDESMDTVIGLHHGKVYTHSDVLFLVAKELGGFWNILLPLQFLPRGFRNFIYRWVARNRYRWFGKQESCILPTSDIEGRFL